MSLLEVRGKLVDRFREGNAVHLSASEAVDLDDRLKDEGLSRFVVFFNEAVIDKRAIGDVSYSCASVPLFLTERVTSLSSVASMQGRNLEDLEVRCTVSSERITNNRRDEAVVVDMEMYIPPLNSSP